MNSKNLQTVFNLRFFLVFSLFVLFCTLSVQAKKLNVYLSYSAFSAPETGPYIETYISVVGKSVNFVKNSNDKFQATIQVIVLFRNGDEIVNYDKYELFSPELDDTLNVNFNFVDQQRYLLPNGNYDFDIQIWDKNNDIKPYVSLEPLVIDFPADKVTVSGIQLVDSYTQTDESTILTKNGYDIIPYINNFYPENINKITFYSEVYNTDKILGPDQKFLLCCYLQSVDKSSPLSKFVLYKKAVSSPVNVVFNEFDITNLESGNYFIVIEARDQKNSLLGLNRIFFQRSNPRIQLNLEDISGDKITNSFAGKINNIDTLIRYISYLDPISSEQERYFARAHLKSSDITTLQKFFYNFWISRNNLEPEKAWLNYLSEVNKVNYAYSTQIQEGFGTDRGRVYLKYGQPNAISESYNEPATYPYEIWHYYQLENGQRNKKFIFYTRDIVTNDFTLLHSDVTGEISNYRWQYVLYQRVDAGFNIDQGVQPDNWGGNSKKYFDLPR